MHIDQFTRLSLSEAPYSKGLQPIQLSTIVNHISIQISSEDSACPIPFSLAANKGIIIYFLFLLVLRCFNSQGISSSRIIHVLALGHRGIKSRMQIPHAFRSLPRPSSHHKPSYPSNSISKSTRRWKLITKVISNF